MLGKNYQLLKTNVMKTNRNFPENGIAITLDALIFANRNKAYGAYELRRKYKKHLFIAFFFALVLFISGISVPYIHAKYFNEKKIQAPPKKGDYVITDLDEPKPIVPPPPVNFPDASRFRYQAIMVVDTVLNETDELMPFDDILANTNNDFDELALVPISKPEDNYFDPDKVEGITMVQENATFQGGDLRGFQIWVQRNVTYPVDAAQANIQGKVILEFCVNTKGEICDIKVLRGPHPSMNDECIKILMNSPKWNPAKQNGRLVKQKFTLPIQFILAS